MPGKSAAIATTTAHGPPPHPSHLVAPSSSPTKPAVFKAIDRSTSASATVKSLLGAFATATNVTAIKKHEDHDASQLFVEKRLFASRNSKKLDLSATLSSHHTTTAFPAAFHIAARDRSVLRSSRARTWWQRAPSLPEELGQLKNLEALYLEKNRFKTIPMTTVFPFQLRDLRLDGNSLIAFPIAITKLRLLNNLGLSHNQIREIPLEIRRLHNLVELDLDFNCIGPELPSDEMQLLTKLERLGLESNRLGKEALEWTKRMPNLTYLRISGNRAPSSSCSNEEDVTGPDGIKENQSVPVRHDGYFQCTQGYHRDGKDVANPVATTGDDDEVSHGGVPRALLLEGLVPCQEQNFLNAEIYRAGLASGLVHQKT